MIARLPRSLRAARRCFTTYDSQSGQHVERVAGVLLHELSLAEATTPDMTTLRGARIDSFEVLRGGAAGLTLGSAGRRAYLRLSAAEHSPEFVEQCLQLGAGASLDLDVGLGLAADAAITRVIRFAELAAERPGLPVRVCLLDALSHESPGRVELVCAKLADAGVGALVLVAAEDDPECSNLEDLVEALLGADVLGAPMSDRVGVRTRAGTEAGAEVCRRAMELGVRRFDTSLAAAEQRSAAPHPARLAAVAAELGLSISE